MFAPHRAIYDLSLDETNSGSGVAGVSGRIVYELTGSPCEGYAQSMRFVTQTVTQEGDTQVTGSAHVELGAGPSAEASLQRRAPIRTSSPRIRHRASPRGTIPPGALVST